MTAAPLLAAAARAGGSPRRCRLALERPRRGRVRTARGAASPVEADRPLRRLRGAWVAGGGRARAAGGGVHSKAERFRRFRRFWAVSGGFGSFNCANCHSIHCHTRHPSPPPIPGPQTHNPHTLLHDGGPLLSPSLDSPWPDVHASFPVPWHQSEPLPAPTASPRRNLAQPADGNNTTVVVVGTQARSVGSVTFRVCYVPRRPRTDPSDGPPRTSMMAVPPSHMQPSPPRSSKGGRRREGKGREGKGGREG